MDTHCHLQLDERPAGTLLGRAPNVAWVVAPGVDEASSEASLALAREFPGRVLATAGLHPHEASLWPEQADSIARIARDQAVVAVGETGLDYYRELSPRGIQRQAFRDQLALAGELGMPVIVHCRDAFADTYELVEQAGLGDRVVLHCWTGGRRWTRRFLELDVVFSFAGPLAFETGETIRLGASLVPPERALVETDTPYLSPPPHRGEANEPARVALVGAALADVWGSSVFEVESVTAMNAGRVFGH